MELKNVSRYYPENERYGSGVQYFIDAHGSDFYDSLEKFTKKYKLCIDPETKVVCSIAEDVSTLYPVGFDVVEIDYLPDDINIKGDYQFIDDTVVKRIYTQGELIKNAEAEKISKVKIANDAILTLQDAVDLNIATVEEEQILKEWKQYRLSLSQVDVRTAPDIDWPKWPE